MSEIIVFDDELEEGDVVEYDGEEGYVVGSGLIDDGCCNPFVVYAVQWMRFRCGLFSQV